jgi:hypothetical protein
MPESVFNIRIVFTGVCSLVTDKPLSEKPSVLHLILLDGWHTRSETEKPPIDKREFLMRHGAMVQFPLRNMWGAGMPRDGRGVWYPKRHRLSFDFWRLSASEDKLSIDDELPMHVADMNLIAPSYARIGGQDDVLNPERPPGRVLASATFSQGMLSADLENVNDWKFPGILSNGSSVERKGMAYKVVLNVHQVKRLILRADPFEGDIQPRHGNPGQGRPEILEICGAQGETVEITIANLCDENSLIWPAGGDDPPKKDLDFKWHYEILAEEAKTDLFEDLKGEELPVPILQEGPQLGRGRNCFPGFYSI